ncbi:coiled-coil domain-containing protein [Gimesia algae]|uniref:Uncharacterized protein n=1 Tax=Gimesia algae TaxID=2527971 RepID=A0A517VI93_9PLAN|nr:hypothetical protein [Gimesia algae]QDT92726.1 hypothetical protein Pan161_43960 [Gimesia algae]
MEAGQDAPQPDPQTPQIDSLSEQGSESDRQEERTRIAAEVERQEAQLIAQWDAEKIQHMAELETELLEKEELVERLTEQLTQVAERLERSQHTSHELKAADNHRIQELESIRREEEALIAALKDRLSQVAEQLERSQQNQHELTESDLQRLQELETELREKETLVSTLTARLSELAEQLKVTQREKEELSAADQQRILELQTELEEKEQLVVILTERLEQVAEQLDRRHRTGADRGMTISNGIPPEVIEEQQKLTQDLHSLLEQWQGMETESALTQIQLQIAELKQVVQAGFEKSPAAPQPASLVDYLSSPTVPGTEESEVHEAETVEEESQASEPEETNPGEVDADSTVSGWEAMKQKLMSGQGVDVSMDLARKDAPKPKPQVKPETPASLLLKSEPADSVGRTLASYKPPIPEAPSEIDEESASPDQLVAAIRERDQYISALIKRLREAETAVIPVNWDQLNNAPAELLEQLQTLHHDLEHSLGLAEVEISIERARLSRTQSMLQSREEQIRKKEKQLGLNLERSEQEEVPAEKPLNDDQKKRWLGFLN